MSKSFHALIVAESPSGQSFSRAVGSRSVDDLPAGDVLIRVLYSSLNYKDALSATGNKGVTRRYPHTPGIDAAGIVEESNVAGYRPGEEVLVTGYDLGSNTSGGFAGYIRVPSSWVVIRPEGLTLRECMIFGTAGFTAALGVHKLQLNGVTTSSGDILVTGATGGVGSLAVAILALEGYHVVAATGKVRERDFLLSLGAAEVIGREDVTDQTGRPLLAGRWGGGIDTVGGAMLESAIRATQPEGAFATCGNVASGEIATSIYPFILRGVSLLGIGSAFTPTTTRQHLWNMLSTRWKVPALESLVTETDLHGLDHHIDLILRGGQRGRVLVNVQEE